ncbi:unnamed protein product [Absidia cylindrospora]
MGYPRILFGLGISGIKSSSTSPNGLYVMLEIGFIEIPLSLSLSVNLPIIWYIWIGAAFYDKCGDSANLIDKRPNDLIM